MGANNVKPNRRQSRDSPKSKSLLRISTSLNRSHGYSSSNRLSANNNCNLAHDLDIYFVRQLATALRVSQSMFCFYYYYEKQISSNNNPFQ